MAGKNKISGRPKRTIMMDDSTYTIIIEVRDWLETTNLKRYTLMDALAYAMKEWKSYAPSHNS